MTSRATALPIAVQMESDDGGPCPIRPVYKKEKTPSPTSGGLVKIINEYRIVEDRRRDAEDGGPIGLSCSSELGRGTFGVVKRAERLTRPFSVSGNGPSNLLSSSSSGTTSGPSLSPITSLAGKNKVVATGNGVASSSTACGNTSPGPPVYSTTPAGPPVCSTTSPPGIITSAQGDPDMDPEFDIKTDVAIKVFRETVLRRKRDRVITTGSGRRVMRTALDAVEEEIVALRRLRSHPNIVRLLDVMRCAQKQKLYLVLDYHGLGSAMEDVEEDEDSPSYNSWFIPALKKRGFGSYSCRSVQDRSQGAGSASDPRSGRERSGHASSLLPTHHYYPERVARRLVIDLLRALNYLHHEKRMAHRDVKPHNLLINHVTGKGVLCDFGRALSLDSMSNGDDPSRHRIRETEGTYQFFSPEMTDASTEEFSASQQDSWAAGVTLYCLLFGRSPFYAPAIMPLFDRIKAIQYDNAMPGDDRDDLGKNSPETTPTTSGSGGNSPEHVGTRTSSNRLPLASSLFDRSAEERPVSIPLPGHSGAEARQRFYAERGLQIDEDGDPIRWDKADLRHFQPIKHSSPCGIFLRRSLQREAIRADCRELLAILEKGGGDGRNADVEGTVLDEKTATAFVPTHTEVRDFFECFGEYDPTSSAIGHDRSAKARTGTSSRRSSVCCFER
ncbi:unnamed protein product [Amoebophrya sp. A25]|nr:unnamed protein product [Amoebophrya sp. A25]|eukprot:GSA25T00026728001.1